MKLGCLVHLKSLSFFLIGTWAIVDLEGGSEERGASEENQDGEVEEVVVEEEEANEPQGKTDKKTDSTPRLMSTSLSSSNMSKDREKQKKYTKPNLGLKNIFNPVKPPVPYKETPFHFHISVPLSRTRARQVVYG
jgi:hypothetical protein